MMNQQNQQGNQPQRPPYQMPQMRPQNMQGDEIFSRIFVSTTQNFYVFFFNKKFFVKLQDILWGQDNEIPILVGRVQIME